MVRDDTTLKPLSVANQLEEILREHGPTMEVTALCSKFIQKFHVSVANVVQMRPMDFIMQEKEKFAMIGASSVTLKEFVDSFSPAPRYDSSYQCPLKVVDEFF